MSLPFPFTFQFSFRARKRRVSPGFLDVAGSAVVFVVRRAADFRRPQTPEVGGRRRRRDVVVSASGFAGRRGRAAADKSDAAVGQVPAGQGDRRHSGTSRPPRKQVVGVIASRTSTVDHIIEDLTDHYLTVVLVVARCFSCSWYSDNYRHFAFVCVLLSFWWRHLSEGGRTSTSKIGLSIGLSSYSSHSLKYDHYYSSCLLTFLLFFLGVVL